MVTTRIQLDFEIDRLSQQLPQLGSDEDASFDYLDFQARAQALVDQAPPEERAYAHDRITCLLASAGLIPSETEGDACPPHP